MTKVLVIEDERYLLEDITELLQYTNFEVQGANGGRQGLRAVREYTPDLIICDVMMPDVDGFQVLEAVRSSPDTANIPFIFLTAKADRDSLRQGMELGADDYLTKPFTSAELLGAISTRVKRQSQISIHTQQKLDTLKQRLARVVTHELRTPLISINTVVDVISRQIGQLSPDELQELLDTITVGSRRLSHRVEQLVFITQLDAGMLSRDVIVREGMPIRMWELLISANNLARRFAYQQKPGVSVQFYDCDRDVMVMGNPPALKQALAELIANALTFSPENGEVHLSQWVSAGQMFIRVVDEGPGIPEDRLAEALADFSQLDRDTNEQQGMGMGLSLAQRIIGSHGGDLEIRSVVDKGTQVTVMLPVLTG